MYYTILGHIFEYILLGSGLLFTVLLGYYNLFK